MAMEFDTPFDRWLRAQGIRPARLARKAKLSRPTILRMRKGSLGRAGTRTKLVAACSAFVGRRVTEAELLGLESDIGRVDRVIVVLFSAYSRKIDITFIDEN
jgi:hypothetical protein